MAETDSNAIHPATYNTIAAAQKIGGDVTVIVAGEGVQSVADQLSKTSGVGKVRSPRRSKAVLVPYTRATMRLTSMARTPLRC